MQYFFSFVPNKWMRALQVGHISGTLFWTSQCHRILSVCAIYSSCFRADWKFPRDSPVSLQTEMLLCSSTFQVMIDRKYWRCTSIVHLNNNSYYFIRMQRRKKKILKLENWSNSLWYIYINWEVKIRFESKKRKRVKNWYWGRKSMHKLWFAHICVCVCFREKEGFHTRKSLNFFQNSKAIDNPQNWFMVIFIAYRQCGRIKEHILLTQFIIIFNAVEGKQNS